MPADIVDTIANLLKEEADANKEISNLEVVANKLEEDARTARAKRFDLKKRVELIRIALRDSQIVKETQDAASAAKKSQSEAESFKNEARETAARLADKERSLDEKSKRLEELLAKAEEAAKPKE